MNTDEFVMMAAVPAPARAAPSEMPSSASVTISRPVTIVIKPEPPRRQPAAQHEDDDDKDARRRGRRAAR